METNKPKTSLADQQLKGSSTTSERKVKHLDSLYSAEFLTAYFK
jgi:hypothetical protein